MDKEKQDAMLERLKRKMQSHPELKYWYWLRDAVCGRHYSDAITLLKEHPYLINTRNPIGETVLHFLAVENDLEGVTWLPERGFDLNTKTNFGDPVIFDVAGLRYKDLLLWFKTNGADFQVKNKSGQNLTEYLKYRNETEMVDYVEQILT